MEIVLVVVCMLGPVKGFKGLIMAADLCVAEPESKTYGSSFFNWRQLKGFLVVFYGPNMVFRLLVQRSKMIKQPSNLMCRCFRQGQI